MKCVYHFAITLLMLSLFFNILFFTSEVQALENAKHGFYSDLRSSLFNDMAPVDAKRDKYSSTRLRVGATYNRFLTDNWWFDTDVRATFIARDYLVDRDKDTSADIEFKRLYLRYEQLFASELMHIDIGRRALRNERSWLYDNDIDLIELNYDSTQLDLDIGVAKWLWDGQIFSGNILIRDDDESIQSSGTEYFYAGLEYQWYYNQFLEFRLTHENFDNPLNTLSDNWLTDSDELTVNSSLTWLSLNFHGKSKVKQIGQLSYWLQAAVLNGDRKFSLINPNNVAYKQNIDNAYAYDIGALMTFKHKYALGFSLASGSGDAEIDSNNIYIQPYIAKNKHNFLGTTRYHYYGEALDPVLTNLDIYSVYGGLSFANNLSLDVAVHKYRQRDASTLFFSTRSNLLPNGILRDIGSGVDFVLSGNFTQNLLLSFILSGFWGGDAFDKVTSDKSAHRAVFKVRYNW